MRLKLLLAASAALSACTTANVDEPASVPAPAAARPVAVKIIAFNDFHGNLEPPHQSVAVPGTGSATEPPLRAPAGGAAYLASAIERLRAENPNNAVVAAGDMIGASPLVSNIFLDEPTILAMNLIRVDFNAVGNHEFDRGREELLRMQHGGCARYTLRDPCRIDSDFPGADFDFLAANVTSENGQTLFPAYGIRRYGSGESEVRVAFIGMTLEGTPTVVSPGGVEGLRFGDEADTVNALLPRLRAEGADAVVVLIHQGLDLPRDYPGTGCDGLEGELREVLDRLDPQVDLVVSGHTHNAYICDYATVDPARPFLVTSAGRYGAMLTDIDLVVDPARGDVVAREAANLIVQSEPYTSGSGPVPLTDRIPAYERNPAVAALVERYAAAAAPLAARVVGRLTAPATRSSAPSGESVLGNLIADSQLAATSAPQAGGARIAFMNGFGVRADIVPGPDGSVTFGQVFAAQPFGNSLVVKSFTGRQIRALLEQQWNSGSNSVERPNMLMPSRGLSYAYDLSRPAGQRILDLRLDSEPIRDDAVYRVTMNSFLATGGDNFTVFREGADQIGGPLDLDALEAYLAASGPLTPPTPDRIVNRTPQ